MKKSRVILAAAGGFLAVVAVAAAFGYFRYVTVDSRYCASCHVAEMAETRASHIHPLELASCNDCHGDPECRTATGRFAAVAENLNARCLECHGDIPEQDEPKKQLIKMSHKIHIGQEGGVCTDCHLNVAHDPFEGGTNRPGKETCYGCHEHKVEIDGEVNEKNCMRCHYVIPDVPTAPAEEKKE
ncbi:MAG: cytochrome c3 family protein [Planctomycetota bacterium]